MSRILRSRSHMRVWGLLLLLTLPAVCLADAEPAPDALPTAVALNYCRASFHRIRKYPTEEVLAEEQRKILNNLNLSRLEDKELIALYTSVLDEIGQMGLADKERVLYEKHHASTIRRQVTWDALAFGTDLATAQFGSAIRTGANSWWDYRSKVFQRDIELHKIDKTRATTVVQRSSQFLDTFWTLTRKKNIPDRWLVRGDDLDQLEAAQNEADPQIRERVLRRMEPFMQAYPPYWYYLARTKQELGQLTTAAEIYQRLEQIASGHFRKDELLSTAMANLAAIQDFLGDETAVASAEQALDYSTEAWEANLICARVLQRHGAIDRAEDAILRNLDVGLEQPQSHVFLASLYYFSEQRDKLAALLGNPAAVAHLPAPVLLRCAALLGAERTPPVVLSNIASSLEAFPPSVVPSEPLVVRVGHAWQLHLAKLKVVQEGQTLSDPQITRGNGFYDLRFAAAAGGFSLRPSAPTRSLELELTYPDESVLRVTLTPTEEPDRSPFFSRSPSSLRIADVRIGDQVLGLRSAGMQRVDLQRPESPRMWRESAVPSQPLGDPTQRGAEATSSQVVR